MSTTYRKRLRAVREAAGLSTRELSRLAGVPPVTVSQIELGRYRRPTFEAVAECARILGCSLSWLAWGCGDAPSPATSAYAIDRAYARLAARERKARVAA